MTNLFVKLGNTPRMDLSDIFMPRRKDTNPRAAVNIRTSGGLGVDISSLFQPVDPTLFGFDKIDYDTGFIAIAEGKEVDIRHLFQRKGFNPYYEIVPTINVVNEGDTIIVNVNTKDVQDGTVLCYYTNSDSDFIDPTGTITIQQGVATFTLTAQNDLTTEGNKQVKILLKNCATQVFLAESAPITIIDTSKSPPTYSISTAAISVNEGSSIIFDVETTDVDDQTVLYYNTSSDEDFVRPTGSVTIVNNRASFTLTALNDLTTEGPETFEVYLKTGSSFGTIVATSNTVTINDTSRSLPTYTITPDKTSVREGSTVAFTVETTNVDNGTRLYYTTSAADDITPSSGSLTVNSNRASFTLTVKEDMLVESGENFTVLLRTTSVTGDVVVTSVPIYITTDCYKGALKLSEIATNPLGVTPVSFGNFGAGRYVIEYVDGAHSNWATLDRWMTGRFTLKAGTKESIIGDSTVSTSSNVVANGRLWNNNFNVFEHTGGEITLAIIDDPLTDNRIHPTYGAARYAIYDYTCGVSPTYALQPDKVRVTEGDSIKVTVKTTGVPNGTVLFYNTTSDADFDIPSGYVTVYNDTAEFTLTVKRDGIYETTETFIVNLRRGSVSGAIAATSQSITIIPAVPTYNTSFSPTTVKEGETTTVTITTTDVQDGTKLYFSTTSNSDFVTPTGEVTVNNNTAQFSLTVKGDGVYEGRELVNVLLKTESQSGTLVHTSEAITLTDAAATFRVVPDKISVSEGGSVKFTITTTDAGEETLYYDINYKSSSSSADFTGVTSGSVTLNDDGNGTFDISISNDLTTEGVEKFTARIRTSSVTGTIVAESSEVTINDTSTSPPTYSISTSNTTVDEGGLLICYITTTGVADGTKLFYNTKHNTTNSTDFVGATSSTGSSFPSGDVTITDNTASFNIVARADLFTEGSETFSVRILTGSTSGTVVAESALITVNDTSITPPPDPPPPPPPPRPPKPPTPGYSVEPSSIYVNEGDLATFNVQAFNVASGTVLYYKVINSSTNVTDFKSPTTETGMQILLKDVIGQFTVRTDSWASVIATASFTVPARLDFIKENLETFKVFIYTDSDLKQKVAESKSVTITDPDYKVTPSQTNWSDGRSFYTKTWTVDFNVSTMNVSNGTRLDYEIYRTDTSSSKAITSTTTGYVTIQSGKAKFSVAGDFPVARTDPGVKFYAVIKRFNPDKYTSQEVARSTELAVKYW